MKTKENKGITLIALVVTIIVLLILAGVSITMLTGQNGILNRAKEAKEKTELSQKEENTTLSNYGKTIDKYISNLPSTEYTTPYLPDETKFEIVDGTNLENGLVVREKITQSEYVWVEVPTSLYNVSNYNNNEKNSPSSSTDSANIEYCLKKYTELYRQKTSYVDSYYEDTDNSEEWFKNENEYNTTYKNMLKSVYENGGFWVGRYEAGINYEKESIRHWEGEYTVKHETTQQVLTKANMYPYNNIRRSQAKMLAENVESGKHTSSLMFGLQWDLVLKYVENKTAENSKNESDARTKIQKQLNSDSKDIGNYYNSGFTLNRGKFAQYGILTTMFEFNSNEKTDLVSNGKKIIQDSNNNAILITTGASEETKLQNIYDLAGNVWEWTLANPLSETVKCASRGGDFSVDGSQYPASYTNGAYTNVNASSVGFRIAIY